MNKVQRREKRWGDPLQLIHDKDPQNNRVISLLILNTPINQESCQIFMDLWNQSSLRVCADGGANRLYDFTISNDHQPGTDSKDQIRMNPDFIKGDLDSIRGDVMDHYLSQESCKIIKDEDQDSTDLEKCLRLIFGLEGVERDGSRKDGKVVVIHGGLTGRLDQTISTLHNLLRLESRRQDEEDGSSDEVWVVDSQAGSIACVLEADETRSSVGGVLLSTSNYVLPETEVVEVEVDVPVIWTLSIY
ncbi:Thiamin pyrophosphokinase [Phakopsora pachyrhizi]|uniref:Thiamin pyrophosphokinase n=1 Tax=Phakopsora pachyrhizi TaxID=170000 RepID=A0AAV0BCT8_PHAPC|nr:Thiamin pyrophosphokinase [Phakopsora pachyrhizi]